MIKIRDWVKRFLIDGTICTTFFTLVLTPYVVFITKMNLEQYISWVIMEYTIVMPIVPISILITEKIRKKILEKKYPSHDTSLGVY